MSRTKRLKDSTHFSNFAYNLVCGFNYRKTESHKKSPALELLHHRAKWKLERKKLHWNKMNDARAWRGLHERGNYYQRISIKFMILPVLMSLSSLHFWVVRKCNEKRWIEVSLVSSSCFILNSFLRYVRVRNRIFFHQFSQNAFCTLPKRIKRGSTTLRPHQH